MKGITRHVYFTCLLVCLLTQALDEQLYHETLQHLQVPPSAQLELQGASASESHTPTEQLVTRL